LTLANSSPQKAGVVSRTQGRLDSVVQPSAGAIQLQVQFYENPFWSKTFSANLIFKFWINFHPKNIKFKFI
jgi:hypothetical protein